MNLHLTFKNNEIENFTNVDLLDPIYEETLSNIPDSSCMNVIISESINSLPLDKALSTVNTAVKKLRRNGNISLSMIDFDAICTNYINGNMDYEYLGKIIGTINCVIPNYQILDLLKSRNIKLILVEKKNFLFIVNGIRYKI